MIRPLLPPSLAGVVSHQLGRHDPVLARHAVQDAGTAASVVTRLLWSRLPDAALVPIAALAPDAALHPLTRAGHVPGDVAEDVLRAAGLRDPEQLPGWFAGDAVDPDRLADALAADWGAPATLAALNGRTPPDALLQAARSGSSRTRAVAILQNPSLDETVTVALLERYLSSPRPEATIGGGRSLFAADLYWAVHLYPHLVPLVARCGVAGLHASAWTWEALLGGAAAAVRTDRQLRRTEAALRRDVAATHAWLIGNERTHLEQPPRTGRAPRVSRSGRLAGPRLGGARLGGVARHRARAARTLSWSPPPTEIVRAAVGSGPVPEPLIRVWLAQHPDPRARLAALGQPRWWGRLETAAAEAFAVQWFEQRAASSPADVTASRYLAPGTASPRGQDAGDPPVSVLRQSVADTLRTGDVGPAARLLTEAWEDNDVRWHLGARMLARAVEDAAVQDATGRDATGCSDAGRTFAHVLDLVDAAVT